jgi:hypothetical protein
VGRNKAGKSLAIHMDVGVNFVVFDWNKWGATLCTDAPTLEKVTARIISNEDIWSVQTYLQLVAIGCPATVSEAPRAGKINIVDGLTLGQRFFAPDVYCVGCRGDGHYPGFCQAVIHQNSLTADEYPSIYIPQWPQPGIVPRHQSRCRVETIGFFGHAGINLAPEYKDSAFVAELQRKNCSLIVKGKLEDRVSWNDYSQIDLVLSVRRIPLEHLLLKPVSKLVNAWIAGVPALLGQESAIQAIATDGIDYILIREPADVFRALEAFQTHPDLYLSMRTHGLNRAKAYSVEAVAAKWLETIAELQSRYSAWAEESDANKLVDFHRRVHNHRRHLHRHINQVHKGYKDLGFPARWWAKTDG